MNVRAGWKVQHRSIARAMVVLCPLGMGMLPLCGATAQTLGPSKVHQSLEAPMVVTNSPHLVQAAPLPDNSARLRDKHDQALRDTIREVAREHGHEGWATSTQRSSGVKTGLRQTMSDSIEMPPEQTWLHRAQQNVWHILHGG